MFYFLDHGVVRGVVYVHGLYRLLQFFGEKKSQKHQQKVHV